MTEGPTNLYQAFEQHFPPDRSTLLLTDPAGHRVDYDQASRRSAQLANLLLELGLQPGDRVTVQVEKSPEMLWLYLATLRAGMVYHPVNTAYTEEELEYFLGDAAPSLLVCDPGKQAASQSLCKKTNVANLLTLDAEGTGSLIDRAENCADTFENAPTEAKDLAALLYSSGTTGQPKGIELTHRNLIENTKVLVEYWGFTAEDCLLHALPTFHVHGLFVAIGCVLMSGSNMRWLPKFDAESVMENLLHCTVMMGVPTYYTRLLADPGFNGDSCRSIRLFVSGSAPLLAETFNEFERRCGHTILERYGMTETGMNTSNPLQGERRAGTVGFPLPGVAVRVTGPDGVPVPTGEVGDLQVKGGNVFRGYRNMPEKTLEDFTADGFFITGDKGLIDKDGYVSIVGRSKDMVISGGLNIYPREVELLIDDLPGVVESAVIGLPHPDLGEAVAAVVVPSESGDLSADAIREYVRERAAGFKVPKKVFFVEQLPRNTMGKVQKTRLRGAYASEFSA